jgi:hypothetical protein
MQPGWPHAPQQEPRHSQRSAPAPRAPVQGIGAHCNSLQTPPARQPPRHRPAAGTATAIPAHPTRSPPSRAPPTPARLTQPTQPRVGGLLLGRTLSTGGFLVTPSTVVPLDRAGFSVRDGKCPPGDFGLRTLCAKSSISVGNLPAGGGFPLVGGSTPTVQRGQVRDSGESRTYPVTLRRLDLLVGIEFTLASFPSGPGRLPSGLESAESYRQLLGPGIPRPTAQVAQRLQGIAPGHSRKVPQARLGRDFLRRPAPDGPSLRSRMLEGRSSRMDSARARSTRPPSRAPGSTRSVASGELFCYVEGVRLQVCTRRPSLEFVICLAAPRGTRRGVSARPSSGKVGAGRLMRREEGSDG